MINARSPYIIEVDETGSFGSRLRIFIWNGTGAAPADPQYILSKLIPASDVTQTLYNISPYIREYLTFTTFPNVYNSITTAPQQHYCNVKVERYNYDGEVYTILDTQTYLAYDGYGYYEDGANPQLLDVKLDEGTYYYLYDSAADLATEPLKRAGQITAYGFLDYYVKYTNLVTAATSTLLWVDADPRVKNFPKVNPSWYSAGNLVEIFDDSDVLQWSATFKPIEECKYSPVVVDFINQSGAWQREFFFKASRANISVNSKEYNLKPSSPLNYSALEGKKKSFNVNGDGAIKCNTGWVDEWFFTQLKQLLLSERILVDGKPKNIRTKQLEEIKHVNQNLINYEIEFVDAHNLINNVT